jgi:hypothetical protein
MGIIVGLFAMVIMAAVIVLPIIALQSTGGLVRFVEIACWAAIVIAVVAGGVTIVQSLAVNQTTVAVPLMVHTPDVKVPGVELLRPDAVILSGGADRATLTIKGLSWESRIWLAIEVLFQAGVAVALALVVKKLATNMRRERPFAGLARPMLTSAYVLFGGSVAWSVAGSIGAHMAGIEALELHGWTVTGPLESGATSGDFPSSLTDWSYLGWLEPADWSVTFSFLPFAVAFVLALLGLAFRAGERMQADTAGLV